MISLKKNENQKIVLSTLAFLICTFLCIIVSDFRYKTYPNPIKIVRSFINARQNCDDFNRFIENIRLGKWADVKKRIAEDNMMIEVKGKKLFYLSCDYTKIFIKTRSCFWETFDDCLSKHNDNGNKENKVRFSGGYAVFDNERKIKR